MPTRPAPAWCSSLFPQEVEILSSDSEAGTTKKGGNIRDRDDEDGDSDFEDSSSGPLRKRSKKEQPARGRGDGGSASNEPTSRSSLGKNKEPPATGKQKRQPAITDPGRSERPPDSSDTGGSSRRADEVAPLNGATVVQEIYEHSARTHGGDGDASKAGADSSLSVFGGQATAAEDASSAAAFSTSIFDLQENAKRRNTFQAGLKASLRDDEEPSIAAARGGGSDGDPSSGVGANSSDGGAGTGGASAGRSTTASSSRGKGKGAAAGRVKLTPMEQQVVDLKAKHPGVLLLVECGYRYRFFGEDALAAAKVSI